MPRKWVCTECGKLLGVVANGKVRIQIGRFQYAAGGVGVTIVQAVCPRCSRLNEVAVPPVKESLSSTVNIS